MLATHLIFTTYGFWLSNDPRGSGSDFVRSRELYTYGPATKVYDDNVSKVAHDLVRREAAKSALTFDPVVWSDEQTGSVGEGIRTAVEESRYSVFALAVLRDHVHAVVGRHSNNPRQIMGHFKVRTTQELSRRGRHPFAGVVEKPPSPWAQRGWTVFLDDQEDVRRGIAYVEDNLRWAGFSQSWAFVKPW